MNCPVCKQAMLVLELEQVEIDHCPDCGGIWLDAGELEMLLGDSQHSQDFLAGMKIASTTEKVHRCPICAKKMFKVEFPAQTPVIIDCCKNQHGIWLDAGELEAVLQAAGDKGVNPVLNLLKEMFGGKSGD